MLIRPRPLSMLETSETSSRPLAPAKPIRTTPLSGERPKHHPQRSPYSISARSSRAEAARTPYEALSNDPNVTRQQLADAEEIAKRVNDNSRSVEIEHSLNRHMNKSSRLFSDLKQQPELECLAVLRRSDGYFQVVNRETKQPISCYLFETARYCTEAAAGLERTFNLGGMLMYPELLEHVEAIVLAAAWRETVELEIAAA